MQPGLGSVFGEITLC